MSLSFPLPLYLTLKEMWRNKLRFALVVGVIALITVLVLFTAALSEGLSTGNREYLSKLDANLIVYQADVDLQITSSQLDQAKIRALRRVEGVKEVGAIAFSSGAVMRGDAKPLNVSYVGVLPGLPGEPPVEYGRQLERADASEVIIDRLVALQTGLQVGDRMTLKSIQGTDEEFFDMVVVGVTDGRQYFLRPSVILPYRTWEKVRAKPLVTNASADFAYNIAAVQLTDPTQQDAVGARLVAQVQNVVAVDRVTAYEATPGYSAQQNTLNTQQIFSLLIGALVIGGFFQIQILQRVGQIGMLKAIGASNLIVAVAFLAQIVIVTCLGVFVGGVGVALLAIGLPAAIPVAFRPEGVVVAVVALLLIGPIGGVVAVRSLLKIEPLTALRLS